MSFGWVCSNCTYRHHAPCERCVMCNELRVTRQQMADFVLGKPIPKPPTLPASPCSQTANSSSRQITLDTVFGTNQKISASQSKEVSKSSVPKKVEAASVLPVNPYAKKRPASVWTNAAQQSFTVRDSQISLGANELTPVDERTVSHPSSHQELASERSGSRTGFTKCSHPQSAAPSSSLPSTSTDPNATSWRGPSVQIGNGEAQTDAETDVHRNPGDRDHVTSHQGANRSMAGAPAKTAAGTSHVRRSSTAYSRQRSLQAHPRPGVLLQSTIPTSVNSDTAGKSHDNAKAINARSYAQIRAPYTPGPVPIDPSAAREWIYPENPDYPTRRYQLEISTTAIFHNTLVSLPTGLGKTLIAAVVMYNYHRWFPTGKVLFMAPTLPLVQQQVKACYQIMGIPAHVTAMMTGRVNQEKRLAVWQERSVFFCTPQTVQKDLENGSCPAQDVVCVVLDEAHRAAGNYAYVNVVQYLEHSGAKFRVLGLSATPGANIKAIQKVIDVLGINRIEARSESDPSVAPYTHTRTSEIVVVPQVAASKGIEAALNAIIDPLLTRLRNAGCFHRFGTNHTISCFNIMKECEAYKERTKETSLSGYFFAAQKFVQIRDFLHKQGVGMVRTKLNEMRISRPTGIVAGIVKGTDFAKLWEEVARATCDPHAHVTDARDRLQNNPKLAKLCEILKEHFERARACSKSSRAIVFSQFRDSVSEIVAVLEPYKPSIRSRHFIGQGKGSKSRGDEAGCGPQLQGMNQTEQQNVIREFRNDVYNVLVCTCIGEEGLDIGEVDLIVNYDTLSSPIRSLQRIGRTGRKREGRVVCLVSEGAEEKTMNSSKQKERTLEHALRNPKAFATRPTIQLFQLEPLLVRTNMNISTTFRESQVEGLGANSKEPKRVSVAATRWRLTDNEEDQRLAIFRQYSRVYLVPNQSGLSLLRRRLLIGRELKATLREAKENFAGNTTKLLRNLESSDHAPDNTARMPRLRGFREGNNEALETLFPLLMSDNPATRQCHVHPPPRKGNLKYEIANRNSDDVTSEMKLKENIRCPENPKLSFSRLILEDAKDKQVELNNAASPTHQQRLKLFCDSTKPSSPSLRAGMVEPQGSNIHSPQVDDFRLPTPPDSPSTSADEEGSYSEKSQIIAATSRIACEDNKSPSKPALLDAVNASNLIYHGMPVDDFRLPSPASSSDESDVESYVNNLTGNAATEYHNHMKSVQYNSSDAARRSCAKEYPMRHNVRFSEASVRSQNAASSFSMSQKSSESDATPQAWTRKTKKSAKIILDTPESQPKITDPYDSRKSGSEILSFASMNSDAVLIDTQSSAHELDDESDVVCAVCLAGHSPDEDPIILCDGKLSSGVLCNLAVHLTCYSVHVPLDSEEDWFCDVCAFRKRGFDGEVKCYECNQGVGAGALKRRDEGLWCHVRCYPVKEQQSKRLKRLRNTAAQLNEEEVPERLPLKKLSSNTQANAEDSHMDRKRRCLERLSRFIQEEAQCETDEDSDGNEEEHLRAIEEEEAMAAEGFINDSSQLDYTQDVLGQLDPDANEDALHRALDIEQARREEFSTPCLGRRFLPRQQDAGGSSATPSSIPSSEKALGKMHFIRSVLEHHREGGDAEEIERVYQAMEVGGTQAGCFTQAD